MFSRAGADGIYDSGWFSLRYAILALFLISAIPISRIFCRVMCPLGAIYAICSKFSAFGKVSVDSDTCIGCGKCDRVCPVRLDVRREAGGMECIACGDCIQVCPVKCISRNRQCQLADSETQQKSPVSINSDKQ
jgi:polyferredoxin